MKRLLILLFLLSLFSCIKDRETVKLPGQLRKVVKQMDCECDPVLTKILWHSKIYYVMAWKSSACNRSILYYDENGNPFTPNFMTLDAGQFLETVWTCKK